MIARSLGAAGTLTVLTTCLLAQGLNTNATKDEWEEINFEFNSSILSDGYPSLLRLAELLAKNPDHRVRVTGHTDYVGSNAYNRKLALARANTVRDFLVKYGAPAGQITPNGEGEQDPRTSNATKEGRFMNRRVVLTVTDGQGRVVSAGGVGEAIRAFDPEKMEQCCTDILKRLDKLDEILAAVRDLKGENDKLRSELNELRGTQSALRDQIAGLPKPLTTEQTTAIARAEGERTLEETARRNKKFSLIGLNIGPTFGKGRTGDFTFSGSGRFFSPFGGDGRRAVQAQGEYMYYPGRQEGQFDIGLVNRWSRFQAGAFGSFKYLGFREFQSGGSLAQAAVTLDYLFSRGRVGAFGTKGLKNIAVLNRAQMGPASFLETYARINNQVGVSAMVGIAGDAWLEGNLAYLQSHGRADRPGGMLRLVKPINEFFAFTAEAGWNESLINTQQSGRLVFGVQLGNFIRPKDFLNVTHPVPVDVPRIRYELLTRRIGNSAPVADAGPDQIGARAGLITLDGSGSFDPEGDPLTFSWEQIAGPRVSLTGMNTAQASFEAAEGQSYSFRLMVRDPGGLQSTARVTVSTARTEIRITRFSATPDMIAAGQNAILEWVVENADTVTISPEVGSVRPSGTATVMPNQTTEYVLVARANDREMRASITVRVGASMPRIQRFAAVPTNITPGESSTLSWATEGGASVSISGLGDVPANGSRTVAPSQTTTYVLTVRGADGREVSAPVIVTVASGLVPRVLQFAATPSSVQQPGGAVQLCWEVEGATDISIAPGAGTGLQPTGCQTVTPTTSTTYVLTARGTGGQITATAVVAVGGNVRVTSFSSDPPFSQMNGRPVTLRWTTENATSVVITGNGIPEGTLPVNGSIVVNPWTNSDYTLIAYGPGGAVSAVLHVWVH